MRPTRPGGLGLCRGERGQALLEFALVVPILLLLLLGVVEFARAWNVYEILTDAAREGARQAVVDNPAIGEGDVVNLIREAGGRAGIVIDPGNVQITGFHSGRGNTTTVRIEFDHELQWIGPLLGVFLDDTNVTMVTEFAMRNE